MIRSPSHRATRTALGILLVAGLGCLAPFERLNPHDMEMDLELAIVGGKDSSRTLGEVLVFQVSSEPVLTGYAPAWSTGHPGFLTNYGNGVFSVNALPTVGEQPVVIEAAFLGHTASRVIVLRPAP